MIRNHQNGWTPLSKLTSRTEPNFIAKKHTGDFDYIEISDVGVSDGSYVCTRIDASDLPANAKIELAGGEILVSQVRPTRGGISIADDELENRTVASGAFYVCSVTDIHFREVIWLYLRCMRGVFEKYCGGTSYPTIESRYISRFPVPLFSEKLADQIRDLITASKGEREKSKALLEKAKNRVEKLIEEAVKP